MTTNNRVFAVCSLVLLWSILFAAGARADQNQFSDNGDGTVYDAATGLTWQQEGLNGPFSWQQALAHVESLNTAGIGNCRGWRLPTSKELDRIVDHHKLFGETHIDTDYFPHTQDGFYWTSSSYKQTLKYAINFGDGRQRTRSSANYYYARAVRGECDPADNDGDGFLPAEDCNDNDPNIHPGAVEICDGYVDNNCDGNYDLTCWDEDDDGDGQTENQGDCNDRDPNNFSGNAEVCDGMDNDCDTVADNGLIFDDDEDGFASLDSCPLGTGDDCNDNDAGIHPGAAEICDDLVDQNCDGDDLSCMDVDNDGDGQTENQGDCDDADPDSFSGNTEVLCDNADNDCDGSTDENLTQPTICGVGACAGNTGELTCNSGVWGGDTCDPLAGATAETCDNVDNDCDGSVDEDLSRPTSCGEGECASTGLETCGAGSWGNDSCVPGTPTAEVCDGLDNNCDTYVDEGVTLTFFRDYDGDTYGDPGYFAMDCSVPSGFVADNTDCDDNDADINPGVSEDACFDGLDNNCINGIDEGCAASLVRLNGIDHGDCVQSAFAAISGGSGIIEIQAAELAENLILNQEVVVTIIGGFDQEFGGLPVGMTTISDPGLTMLISNGTVTLENIVLK